MELNAIFEPSTTEMYPTGNNDTTYFRSVSIDIDTIRDAAHTAQRFIAAIPGVDKVSITYKTVPTNQHQDTDVINETDLDALGQADRNRLTFDVAGTDNGTPIAAIQVNLLRGQRPIVWTTMYYHPELALALRRTTIQKFLDNGRPRLDRYKLARYALFLPAIALAAAALWLQLTSTLTPAATLFTWLTVAIIAAATIVQYRRLRIAQASLSVGVHVIMENREKTATRRADRKRDLTIGILVAIVTFALTQLGNVIGDQNQPTNAPSTIEPQR